jgi:ectoine hydroxylase-related dioxygenase (phytanoyl-CoA dioxygenase family)
MNVTKQELWATPVWEIYTGFDAQFNAKLIEEFPTNKPAGWQFDLWDCKTPNITKLKECIMKAVTSEVRPNLSMSRAWVNKQCPGKPLVIHDHSPAILAAVYYVNCPENSGDLLLVDPRGSTNWGRNPEGNISNVKHVRIEPVAGKLVLFPAYILHMVEENKSSENRISIATNIYNRG